MIPRRAISRDDYRAFQDFLERASGIVLGDNKEYLVASRLSGLMRERGLDSLSALLRALRSERPADLRTSVIDAMTTNETFWFRDLPHFRLLDEVILPELANRPGAGTRIWSAACSSGQEPYSLSMVVQAFETRHPGRLSGGVEIVATDISTRVLAQAKRGEYCGMAVSRGLEAEQRRLYFLAKDDCLEVRPEIRGRVQFRELNLSGSYALLGRFDVIFCRNVLIYFSPVLKADILGRMAQALNPGGYLFLGSTESLSGHTDRFEMITGAGGIAYRLRGR
jgi:chemotaxis protein methyltransferase CheR